MTAICVVVVDGAGNPCCIWRTTEVTIKPFDEVDDQFAFDEGRDGSNCRRTALKDRNASGVFVGKLAYKK